MRENFYTISERPEGSTFVHKKLHKICYNVASRDRKIMKHECELHFKGVFGKVFGTNWNMECFKKITLIVLK